MLVQSLGRRPHSNHSQVRDRLGEVLPVTFIHFQVNSYRAGKCFDSNIKHAVCFKLQCFSKLSQSAELQKCHVFQKK